MSEQPETQEFTVGFVSNAWAFVKVEAKNFDEALEKAEQTYEITQSMCHQCAHPDHSGFRYLGDVSRQWPEEMSPAEVTNESGEIVWQDDTVQ